MEMIRTPTEDKALAWFCKTRNLKLELSSHPTYYFTNKDTGKDETHQLNHILIGFNSYREDERTRKRQETRLKAGKKRIGYFA